MNQQQQQSHRLRMLNRSQWGLKLILLPKLIFSLDSAIAKREKKMLNCVEASLHIQCITMYQHGETIKYINILPGNKEHRQSELKEISC